ncbi:MAG: metal ABC transporter permease [Planctomycetes bacterium]|nr:metal ABC transporter permease [Planctomycetota bacterium]
MSTWHLLLASETSLSAWEYAQRFPQVFLAALLFGFVCPLVGSYLLLRRMTMLALALPQLCMAGIACGIFCAPWIAPWFLDDHGHAHGAHDREALPAEAEALQSELEQLAGMVGADAGPSASEHAPHDAPLGLGHEVFHADPRYELAWALLSAGLGLLVLHLLGRRGVLSADARIAGLFSASSALTLLFVAESGLGREHVEHIVRGDLVEIARADFPLFLALFGGAALFLSLYRRPLMLIGWDRESARVLGLRVRLWELGFSVAIGVVIGVGVLVAGPIVLFALLVLPTIAARRFARSFGRQLLLASLCGGAATTLGFAAAIPLDWILGPTIALAALTLLGVSAACGLLVSRSSSG